MGGQQMMKIVVTGSQGLLGWHAATRLHAANCAARFSGKPVPYDVVCLDRPSFSDPDVRRRAVAGAAAVLHFAGVNRAPDDEIEEGNPNIAAQLAEACRATGSAPHIVHANSTHAASDTPYGRSKRKAGEILAACSPLFSDLVLPHIFGECARPNYNNVTATFIRNIIDGLPTTVNPEGRVDLLHAGKAAEIAIDAVLDSRVSTIRPQARTMRVTDLLAKLSSFHELYSSGIYPALADPFDIALFNSYRAALYPGAFPRSLRLNADPRGTLFEAVKGGSGGQTFFSWTAPGVTRGNHFHLGKIERFLVLEGEALIRIRKALRDEVWTYEVNGATPAIIDMPTLHTHSIENVGDKPLLTMFWTNDIFDPANPDTFADPVLGA